MNDTASVFIHCVYCGQAYPEGTPPHGAKILTDHIRVCEKHPMRQLEAEKALLRAALVKLVGVDGAKELDQMEGVIRLTPAPMEDKAAILDAIAALRKTL